MGQCFLDYDGLKQFWKVVKDNFVRLNKEDGSITVNAVKIKDYTDSHVLLAGGGLKPLSEFGSGGGSGSGGTTSSTPYPLTIKINKTSKSFNGSAEVTVDITTNKLINDLGTATATPQDGDYFISQFVGGGTGTTTYHRRPMSSLWAYIKNKTDAQYATSGHTHSNYLPLTGGTLTGDLTTSGVLKATTIKKSGSNSTNDFVLLAGGGTKPLSEFGSGSGSTPTINATLWGNSFNGSGSVNGDIVFFNLGQSVSNSRGIRLHNPGVVNDMAVEASGFIGFSKISDTGTGSFTGISLGWGASPEKSASSVRINNTTFTYKSYPILHSNNFNNYVPSKTGGGASGTWGISISGNAATTTKLSTARTLWGNDFDGTGNIDGDIVFNKPGSLSTVSQGIRLNKAGTSSVGVAVPAEGFIGFTAEKGIQPNFHGISLGWGTKPEKSASSVRINDTTFTYKGNKILHTGNIGDASIPVATASTLNQNIQISDLFDGTAQKSPLIPDFDHTNPPSLLRINFTDTAFVCTLCSTDYTKTTIYHNSHNNYTVTVKNTAVSISR